MPAHQFIDFAITNSGDLIVIPEWVNSAKVYDGQAKEWGNHPLKGRAGDLLLSNEIGQFGEHSVLLADGSIILTPNPTHKDIETWFERVDLPSITGETSLGGVQYTAAYAPSEFQEVDISIVPGAFSEDISREVTLANGTTVIVSSQDEDNIRSFIQEIIMRVRTNASDLVLHPDFGANLEDLIGEWNSPKVANHGIGSIKAQLNQITGMEILHADAIPMSDEKLIFIFRVKGISNNIINIRIDFDFEEGVVIRGGTIDPGA